MFCDKHLFIVFRAGLVLLSGQLITTGASLLKVDFNRIHMGMHFVHGFILDATFRTIIDAIRDQVRGKLGTKIDARTSIEPGPV